ncbi:MAG: J domain-containing protein [Dehalococcoidales bacterium]|nr:J domain-containing protein [Dehalococcoidales bacterium]
MAKKGSELLRGLRTLDDVCKILTGKKLSRVIANGVELFGDDVLEKLNTGQQAAPDFNNPYYIMGIHPDVPDFVVKASFRAWCKELHPDTGTKPDSVKFSKINEAYKVIMDSRKAAAAQ